MVSQISKMYLILFCFMSFVVDDATAFYDGYSGTPERDYRGTPVHPDDSVSQGPRPKRVSNCSGQVMGLVDFVRTDGDMADPSADSRLSEAQLLGSATPVNVIEAWAQGIEAADDQELQDYIQRHGDAREGFRALQHARRDSLEYGSYYGPKTSVVGRLQDRHHSAGRGVVYETPEYWSSKKKKSSATDKTDHKPEDKNAALTFCAWFIGCLCS